MEGDIVKKFLSKIWLWLFPRKRYIFVEVDYLFGPNPKTVFKVKAVNGRFGIIWLYDPCMFVMGENGVCINDMKETEGYGKPSSVAKWFDTYDGPYREYNWQRKLRWGY